MPPAHDREQGRPPQAGRLPQTGSAWQRLGVTAVWLAALTLVGAGCSEMTRYKVLSFFFDGVPPPGADPSEYRRVRDPWGVQRQVAEGTGTTTDAGEDVEQEEEPRIVYHRPYRARACEECHTAEDGYETPTDQTDVCRKCHAGYYKLEPTDWVHGPVAVGECSLCHEAHRATEPALLKVAQPDICFGCHDGERILSRPYHAEAAEQTCSTCHDPHAAGNRLLLADSRTYERVAESRDDLPDPHAAWGKEDCGACHMVDQSFQLVEEIDPQCLTCHGDVARQAADSDTHMAVRQNQCIICHTPHGSHRPHMIKETAEQICYECHSADELNSPPHPPVTRADCLLCHAGHRSEGPHLLRPEIPITY